MVFHNLSGYDSHLFIKNIGFSEGDIDCIPNNKERYISFTKKIQAGSYTKKIKNEEGETVYETRPLHHQIRFIDSFKFIATSLDKLIKNLSKDAFSNVIPNLGDKERYILHYENLKHYLSLESKLTKIHRRIKFEESQWLEKYIALNTELRTAAANEFEKDFFKQMNNSVFGKTMENIRNRVDSKLVNDKKQAEKLSAKPNFYHCNIFSEELVAVHMKKTKLFFNKPVYLGMCILDLSKTLMYDFHYNYIKLNFYLPIPIV